MRLLTVLSVLATGLSMATPGLCLDASVPDAAGAGGASATGGASGSGGSRASDASTSMPDASAAGGRAGNDASAPRPDASTAADAAVPPTLVVGRVCTKASDCAAGLTCLLASGNQLGGGGPARGLCTLDCSANGQADCDALDTGSLCFKSGAVGYCFQRCLPGDTSDAPKCKTRSDMACAPTSAGEGYCKPTCRGDFDCGARKCDLRTGLCKDAVTGSLPIGSTCDTTATKDDCLGNCAAVETPATTDNSMCSAPCSLGAPGGCGVDPASASPPSAACLPLVAGEATGDVGGCFQLCNCDGDCLNSSFLCNPGTSSLGRAGVCVPADQAAGHLACPADGGVSLGAGGKSGTGAGGATGAADAGSDAGSAAPKGGDSGGCGCHVGERRESERGGTLAFAVLGLALLTRRRGARR